MPLVDHLYSGFVISPWTPSTSHPLSSTFLAGHYWLYLHFSNTFKEVSVTFLSCQILRPSGQLSQSAPSLVINGTSPSTCSKVISYLSLLKSSQANRWFFLLMVNQVLTQPSSLSWSCPLDLHYCHQIPPSTFWLPSIAHAKYILGKKSGTWTVFTWSKASSEKKKKNITRKVHQRYHTLHRSVRLCFEPPQLAPIKSNEQQL